MIPGIRSLNVLLLFESTAFHVGNHPSEQIGQRLQLALRHQTLQRPHFVLFRFTTEREFMTSETSDLHRSGQCRSHLFDRSGIQLFRPIVRDRDSPAFNPILFQLLRCGRPDHFLVVLGILLDLLLRHGGEFSAAMPRRGNSSASCASTSFRLVTLLTSSIHEPSDSLKRRIPQVGSMRNSTSAWKSPKKRSSQAVLASAIGSASTAFLYRFVVSGIHCCARAF